MIDSHGRQIDYLRISITDRCNLRCRYCMPEDHRCLPTEDVLSADEIVRLAEAAATAGIVHVKVTGGEPLARADAVVILEKIKRIPGIKTVTLTTNALLLEPVLDRLAAIGMDGINVSLDAVSESLYEHITGRPGADRALAAIRAGAAAGIPMKINTVLLEENSAEWLAILELAEELPIAVRFIERMPIGSTGHLDPVVPASVLLSLAKTRYPDLHSDPARHGNGPAEYFESAGLKGRLGIIAANSRRFCEDCNRIRLTSTGQLRTCLGYPESVDLRELIRSGADRDKLQTVIQQAVAAKPAAHDFANPAAHNPARHMNEIGG